METRQQIKKRMLASAAKMWGYTSQEMNTVDPIIPLLIDACAGELESISASIGNIHQNLGTKLMELLTPEELVSPVPARAIMHAHPFDANSIVTETHEFYYRKKNHIDEDDPDMEIFLTPVREHILFDAEVKFIASGNSLFSTDSLLGKTEVAKTTSKKGLTDAIWVGLRVNKSISSLSGLSFYFDIEQVGDIEEKVFFHALKSSICEINNEKVKIEPGYGKTKSGNNKYSKKFPFTEFNKSHAISKHVLNFYKKHFFSISDNQSDYITDKESFINYPDFFTEIFSPDDLEAINDKFIWVRLKFPEYVPQHVLNKVRCVTNCFPVINRRGKKIVITAYERIKELRVEPHEVFFDLKDIICEENMDIFFGENIPENMEGKAHLTLRKDNVGRMNNTNAIEKIHQMLEAYQKEHSAFSRIKGIDPDDVDKLYDAIRPFEHAIDEIRHYTDGTTPYLMLKTDPEKEDVEVELSYYITNGKLGNQIPIGEPINFDSAELVKSQLFLVCPTMGGIDTKRNEDLMREFRYSILSNGRLVTIEDMKALCEKQFGKYASAIEVKKGVTVDPINQSGITQVINITIQLKKKIDLKPEEIKFLKNDLQLQLEERSLNILPFKIKVMA